MKIAIVGATGLVGRKVIELLATFPYQVEEYIPVASEKSVGKLVEIKGEQVAVISIDEAIAKKPDIAIFSAGGQTSLVHAPRFAEVGCFVIDNSSAWRMDSGKKLIVPEINGNTLTKDDKIIANPNCSTIQMVMVLAPLHVKYRIHRIVVSTYQSVTGTGQKAVKQMYAEREGKESTEMVYPYQIDLNCIPQCDIFLDNDYTKEEMKLVNETRKILDDQTIQITATAVRIPVIGGHGESVNITFRNDFELDDIKSILSNTPGVKLQDNPATQEYPMPLTAHNKDEVFVGRIRKDISNDKGLNLWIVADNIRKGAATNAVQIAEIVVKKFFA